jgi:hypothetical protein
MIGVKAQTLHTFTLYGCGSAGLTAQRVGFSTGRGFTGAMLRTQERPRSCVAAFLFQKIIER